MEYIHLLAQKLVLVFMTITFSIGAFFSFVIAPILFKNLTKELAGSIVEKVFPIYFGLCLFFDAISLLAVFKANVGFLLILILILTITLNAVQLFIMLPTAMELKQTQQKEEFLKLHRISVIINLSVIFLNFAGILYLLFKGF
jgi:hypothetical protein